MKGSYKFAWLMIIIAMDAFCNLGSADSTDVTRSSTLKGSYISVTSTPPTITNENYSTLPACPATINYCRDINNTLPAGVTAATSNANCPDQCIKARVLDTSTTPITSTTAVCPTGYAATATFNMQQEYQYSPASSDNAIADTAELNNYIAAGYSCDGGGGSYYTASNICGSPPGPYFNSDIIPASYIGVTGNTNLVKIFTSTRNATTCGFVYYTYTYTYQFMYCYRAAGLLPTSHHAPTSIVCTRMKPSWQKTH